MLQDIPIMIKKNVTNVSRLVKLIGFIVIVALLFLYMSNFIMNLASITSTKTLWVSIPICASIILAITIIYIIKR